MGGFGSDEIPDWVRDRFDERTTLPHGPLEHFPIPLEGQITGARSSVPSDGGPARWNVIAACAEPIEVVLNFYDEYLPLSGYQITAAGTIFCRRSWFARGTAPAAELFIVRRDEFVGSIIFEPGEAPERTRLEAEMAQRDHPCVRELVNPDRLRSHGNIRWHLAP